MPGIFEHAQQFLMSHTVCCMEAQGQHFENFLQFVAVKTEICNVGIRDL
jgi:hypothetical protein